MNTLVRSMYLTACLLITSLYLSAQSIKGEPALLTGQNAEATAKHYYDAGYRHLKQGAYDSAISYLTPAFSYYRKAGQAAQQAKVQNDLSLAYTELGLYEEALKLSLEALRYFEMVNDTQKVAMVQINTGQLYNTLEQYTKAEQYLKTALQGLLAVKKSPELPFLLASTYNNLGTALLNNKHTDSALHYYQKALQIKYEIGNDKSTAYTLNNIGTVYSGIGQYTEALRYLEASLALKRKSGNPASIAHGYNNIGNVFIEQKEYARARVYFDSAYTLAATVNNPALMSDVYANLAKAYAGLGQYQKAYAYQEQYAAITDTLNNAAIAGRTAELQMVYEVYKKDKELQNAQARVDLLKAEGSARANRLAFLASLTAGLVVVLLLLLRNLRLRKKNFRQKEALLLHEQQLKEAENSHLKTEIGLKNKDLSSLSLQSLQKKEMIQRVKEELKAIDDRNGRSFTLTQLSRHIEDIYPEEADWAAFKTNFEQAHPGFFEKLGTNAAQLSLLDLRHCAYIRTGLITKEIAGLLHIAPESVQKSRVRLKKKLGLAKETDLITYIKSL